jgi:selenocysteine-specific elongation factor
MIIGTAGHIDHGKTALVKALTGVDADRLREEKARGITIDLGFAYMPDRGGGVLGFVDVPGHDRFVRNMLAGATGIDFMLLTVAADDGIMPQTREHFEIVNLLGLTRGIVALTKCDLVGTERRADVVRQIETLLQNTAFAEAKIVPVSSITGEGIDELREEFFAEARSFSARGREGLFRLAVDRSFSLQGVGTVVTGAVLSGSVRVDDTVVVSPSGHEARVRSIHAQNRPVETGQVGERCALNLVGEGISTRSVGRGDVVLERGAHAPTDRIDATLQLLGGEPRELAHWTPVRLHHAASETGARVALLHEEPIAPGESGRVQLVVSRPIAAAVGDRFIIRDTTGSRTIGGGRFVDLRGPYRRRRTPQRLAQLDALVLDDPAETLARLLEVQPYAVDFTGFVRDRAMGPEQAARLLAGVPHVRTARGSDDLLISPAIWKRLSDSARAALADYHRSHPQLLGPGIGWLAGRLEPRHAQQDGRSGHTRAHRRKERLCSRAARCRLPGHTAGARQARSRPLAAHRAAPVGGKPVSPAAGQGMRETSRRAGIRRAARAEGDGQTAKCRRNGAGPVLSARDAEGDGRNHRRNRGSAGRRLFCRRAVSRQAAERPQGGDRDTGIFRPQRIDRPTRRYAPRRSAPACGIHGKRACQRGGSAREWGRESLPVGRPDFKSG